MVMFKPITQQLKKTITLRELFTIGPRYLEFNPILFWDNADAELIHLLIFRENYCRQTSKSELVKSLRWLSATLRLV